MELIEDLRDLQRMHKEGALTDAEFSAAKAHLFCVTQKSAYSSLDGPGMYSEKEIRRLRLDLAVAELDRAWEVEREPYLGNPRRGSQSVPTESSARIVLIVTAIIGLSFCCIPMPFFICQIVGALLILLGIWLYRYCLANIAAYEDAYDAYRKRRAAIAGDADIPTASLDFAPAPHSKGMERRERACR